MGWWKVLAKERQKTIMGPPIPSELQEAVERQRRIRIRLSLAAYAYEFDNDSIISDAEFDALAIQVIPAIITGHDVMDKFFKEVFIPDSGMWVHNHPELDKLKALYDRLKKQGVY
jgi:hypothetical protein